MRGLYGLLVGERDFAGSLFHAINKPRFDHQPADRLQEIHRRLEQLAREHDGPDECRQHGGLADHSALRPRRPPEGLWASLKRSGKADLPEDISRPPHIAALETLNIFGIKADYMAQFREFLEEEGLPPNDERIEFLLPVIRNLGSKKLKTIRLKKTINGVSTEFGDAFKKLGPIPTLRSPIRRRSPRPLPSEKPGRPQLVSENPGPEIQRRRRLAMRGRAAGSGHLTAQHVAFLDLDALYFELQRFKAERGWHNLNLSARCDLPTCLPTRAGISC